MASNGTFYRGVNIRNKFVSPVATALNQGKLSGTAMPGHMDRNWSDLLTISNLIVDQKTPGIELVAGNDSTGWLAPAQEAYPVSRNRLIAYPAGHAYAGGSFLEDPWYKNRFQQVRQQLTAAGDVLPNLNQDRSTWTPMPTPNWIPYPRPQQQIGVRVDRATAV